MARHTSSTSRKNQLSIAFQIGLIASLAFLSLAFYAVPKPGGDISFLDPGPEREWDPDPVPLTRNAPMPKPDKPIVPVPSPEPDFPDNVTIDDKWFKGNGNEIIHPPRLATDPDDAVLRGFQVSNEPELISKVLPEYPRTARILGFEGTVICKIIIEKDGSVGEVTIVRSIPMLDSAAVSALRQWRFSPGRQNLRPVRVLMTVPVNFSLR